MFRDEKRHVTGRVSGGVDGFQRYTAQVDAFAVGQSMVNFSFEHPVGKVKKSV